MKTLFFAIPLILLQALAPSDGQPVFKGGAGALSRFLSSRIVYPEYSKQYCISGTIKVSFRLDKNGDVIDEKVAQGLGIDLDDEALRVVKLTSGKWILPAGYNSYNMILPVKFEADQTPCRVHGGADMALAIRNYKIQQGLEDAITHYYADKYAGKANPALEPKIIALKKQLGYDDAFIDDMLNDAQEKLKQSDTAGACSDWSFIRDIGSNRADKFLAQYCGQQN